MARGGPRRERRATVGGGPTASGDTARPFRPPPPNAVSVDPPAHHPHTHHGHLRLRRRARRQRECARGRRSAGCGSGRAVRDARNSSRAARRGGAVRAVRAVEARVWMILARAWHVRTAAVAVRLCRAAPHTRRPLPVHAPRAHRRPPCRPPPWWRPARASSPRTSPRARSPSALTRSVRAEAEGGATQATRGRGRECRAPQIRGAPAGGGTVPPPAAAAPRRRDRRHVQRPTRVGVALLPCRPGCRCSR